MSQHVDDEKEFKMSILDSQQSCVNQNQTFKMRTQRKCIFQQEKSIAQKTENTDTKQKTTHTYAVVTS